MTKSEHRTERQVDAVSPTTYFITALAIVVAMWGCWLLEANTDFRITGRGKIGNKPALSIWFPAIVTPLALVVAFFWWRRSAGIAKNGIFANATITAMGVESSNMQDVTLSYSVGSQSYSKRLSTSVANTANKSLGDEIEIVVDKRNPKRIFVP